MGLARWLKRLFGGAAAPAGPSCVAYDAITLQDLALGVYRCMVCGYQGGDGYAAYLNEHGTSVGVV